MIGKKILLALVILAAVMTGYVLIKDVKKNDDGIGNIEKIQNTKQEQARQPQEKSVGDNNSTNSTNNTKPMGLEIKTTQEGAGDRVVKAGDHIYVHYTGKLINGTVFDSSVTRGVPFDFTIGQGMVIQGWEQGFIGAKIGEKRTLTIPAELGYGSRDMGTIPPNSTLIFDVEVIDIK